MIVGFCCLADGEAVVFAPSTNPAIVHIFCIHLYPQAQTPVLHSLIPPLGHVVGCASVVSLPASHKISK